MPYTYGGSMLSITIRLLVFTAALSVASESLAITLSDAASMPIGSEVTIDEAVVINATRLSASGGVLIQVRDDTRAVTLYPPPSEFLTGLQNGDVISFSATTLEYMGLFELLPSAEPVTIVSSPTINTSVEPVPVTAQDFDDFSPTAEALESRYVAMQDIELFEGGPYSTFGLYPYPAEVSAAGQSFQQHTIYVAVDSEGNETIVWARSQESVDSLNAYFGTIPAGPFDLPGIFLHAFDGNDPPTGTAGVSYIMNPVIVGMPGDLNYDGFIGIEDLNLILANWNETRIAPASLPGDVTHDDFVGIEDLNMILSNWNTGTPPNEVVGVIPEPGTGLAGLVILLCSANRRRL